MANKTLKSYRFDQNTLQLIEELKDELHLENNSAVLRKAVALLKYASEVKRDGGRLIHRSCSGDLEIVL